MSGFTIRTIYVPSHSKDKKQILSKELHENIDTILLAFNKFLLNWINFLFCCYFFGLEFHTRYELLLFLFAFTLPGVYLNHKLLKYIHDIAIEAIIYDFY